jgi:adenine phosphoribosyltransferase
LAATVELVEQLGGEVVAIIALIELTDLKGRDLLGDHMVKSLVQYPC